MRVLVTGAGGFVGKVVARHLAEAGHEVAAIYRKTEPSGLASVPRIRLVQADLRYLPPLQPGLDACVHCAADVPATCPDPEEMVRSNVEGTRHVFDRARAAGARCFVYLSSMAIYGQISARLVDEETPSTDPDAYGRSKLEGEHLLEAMCRVEPALSGLSIRLPGVVGAGARNNFLANTLAKLRGGQPAAANHPDAPFNNVIHVKDVAEFVRHRLVDGAPGYAVCVVGAREALPMRQVVGLLYAGLGRPEEASWGVQGKTPFNLVLARAEALGFRPATVRDSVERYVRDQVAADLTSQA